MTAASTGGEGFGARGAGNAVTSTGRWDLVLVGLEMRSRARGGGLWCSRDGKRGCEHGRGGCGARRAENAVASTGRGSVVLAGLKTSSRTREGALWCSRG